MNLYFKYTISIIRYLIYAYVTCHFKLVDFQMTNENPNNNSYWKTLQHHILTTENFPDREKSLELVLSMESRRNFLTKSILKLSTGGANNLIIHPKQLF